MVPNCHTGKQQKVFIQNCIFQNPRGPVEKEEPFITENILRITNSAFKGNQAANGGAYIYTLNASILLKYNLFSGTSLMKMVEHHT